MMNLYLDNCCIQRPLDDKSQLRIAVESEIVLNLISLVESGKLILISSDVLEYEAKNNPYSFRREFTLKVLEKAKHIVRLNNNIKLRAKFFMENGIKAIDALHLASAETFEVNFFCTCDDNFLKKSKRIENLRINAFSLLEIIKELDNEY